MIQFNIPVVLCVFNRYENSIKLLESIKDVMPRKLYLVSDGPRDAVEGEKDIVYKIRREIEDRISWECELIRIYSDENMGCAKRISSALDIVFSYEKKAIILEDDCIPKKSFFKFCEDLLDRYENDDRIMSISGCPIIDYTFAENKSYFYSTNFMCWGWATWQRAWKLYDFELSRYEEKSDRKILKSWIKNSKAYHGFIANFNALSSRHKKYSWAYQFSYASLVNKKLNIIPAVNMIDNVGFGDLATNTKDLDGFLCSRVENITFPLVYNDDVSRNEDYDKCYYSQCMKDGWIKYIKQRIGLDLNKPITIRK